MIKIISHNIAENVYPCRKNGLLCSFLALAAVFSLLPHQTSAQTTPTSSPCSLAGLNLPIASTNNTISISTCAPAEYTVEYGQQYEFLPNTGHNFEVVFDWGDGDANRDIVALEDGDLVSGATTSRTHTYPAVGNCVYPASVSLRVDGKICPETTISRTGGFANWSREDSNGGAVLLGTQNVPNANNLVVRVCAGVPIDLTFEDETTLSCQGGVNPNNAERWYQVVYNTSTGNKIPSVTVGSTAITNAQGGDIEANFSPEGVINIPRPVSATYTKPTIATITAPSGFGANAPQAGDQFQVTLRYWNRCNPYTAAVGATNAVTATATIEIVESPPPPVLSDTVFCAGENYSTYTVDATSTLNNPYFIWFNKEGTSRLRGGSSFNPLNYYGDLRNRYFNGTGGSVRVLAAVSGIAPGSTSTSSCLSDTTEATFTMFPALNGGDLSIGTANPSSLTICSGTDPAAFTAPAATGGDGTYRYQWQRAPGASGGSFADLQNDTLRVLDLGPLTATARYRRRVRSVDIPQGRRTSCSEAFSDVFTIVVENIVTPGSVGSAQTICVGGNSAAKLTNLVTSTRGSGTYVYQWESTTDDPATSPNPTIAVIANSDSLTHTPSAALATTTWYRRTVRSGACSAANSWEETAWVKITVNATIGAGSIQLSGGGTETNICVGVSSPMLQELTGPSGGSGYTYQWKSSTTRGKDYVSIPSATTQNDYSPPALTDTTYYVRTVNSGVCSVNSNEVMIAVNKLPTAKISGGGAICSATVPAPSVVINVEQGNAPWTVTYAIDGVSQPAVTVTDVPAATTEAADGKGKHEISDPSQGNYTLVSVTDAASCSATAVSLQKDTAKVINSTSAVPSISSLAPTDSVCHAGFTTNPPDAVITFAPVAAKQYRITYSMANGSQSAVTQPVVSETSDALGQLNISPGYSLWNYRPGTRTLKITEVVDISTGCGVSLPTTPEVALKVDSVPEINNSQLKLICSQDTVNYKILMTGAPEKATKFKWTRDNIEVVRRADTTVHITDVLVNNNQNSYVDVNYLVTPYTSACTGQRTNVFIRVNPEPVITPEQSSAICGGELTSHVIRMTNTPLNTNVTWLNPVTNISQTFLAQNAPTIRDRLSNTTALKVDTTFYYRVTARSAAGCSSTADTVAIVVYPVPVLASSNNDIAICPGQSANYSIALDPAGAPSNTFFSWARPSDPSVRDTVLAGAVNTVHITDTYTTPGIRNYSITATSERGCASSAKTIKIDVNKPPVLANVNKFVCETRSQGQINGQGSGVIDLTGTALLTEIGKKTNDTVTWYVDYNEGVLSSQIEEGTALGQTQKYGIIEDQTVYAEIKSPTGANCISVAQVTLTYQPIPVSNTITYTGSGIYSIGGNELNICMDSTQSHIFQTSSSGTVSAQKTYRWTYPKPESRLATAGSDTTINTITLKFPVRATASSGKVVSVTEYYNGCAGAPKQIIVNTESTAGKSVITGKDIVCTGGINEGYSVSGAPASALYTWTLPAGVSFVANTAQTQGDIRVNFPSALSPEPASGVDTVNIAVRVRTGVAQCVAQAADPFEVLIVQNPIMQSATSATICSRDTVSSGVTLASQHGPSGTTYDWTVTNITGSVGNVTIGNSGSGDTNLGGTGTQLLNRSGAVGSVVYRVTPVGPNKSNGGSACRGPDQNVTISVNPEPVIVSSQSKTVCSDTQIDHEILLTPVNRPVQTVFDWPAPVATITQAGSNVSSGAAGTAHIKDRIENKTLTTQVYTYEVDSNDGQTTPKCTGETTDVVITINPEPVGVNDTIAVCSNVQLSYDLQDNVNGAAVSGIGLVASFSWFATDNPNVTGETLSGGAATSGTINDKLINHTNTEQIVLYTVVPSNKFLSTSPSCEGSAFTVRVVVRPEPVGKNANVTVCSDVALEYDLQNNIATAGGGLRSGITYAWVVSTPNPDLTRTAAGAGTSRIDDKMTNITITDQQIIYTVTPTHTDVNNNTCDGGEFDIQVSVSPEPRGAPFSKTICSRETPNINLQNDVINSSGNKLTATFSWVGEPNSSLTGISASSTNAIIADVLSNTTSGQQNAVYKVVPSATSAGGAVCAGDTFAITVTVNPEPVGVVIPDTTICSGGDLEYDIQAKNIDTATGGNNVPSTFSWSAALNATVDGEQTTTQSTSSIAGKLHNKTNASSRVAYTVTPTSRIGSCVGSAFQVGVVVNPEPVGFNTGQTICGGVALNYNLQTANIDATGPGEGNRLPSTFIWKASPNSNVSGLSTVEKSTAIIDDVIVNQGSRSQTVTYSITPTSSVGMCRGDDFTFSVIVNPQPQSSASTTTICSGGSVNRNLASNISNSLSSTYMWQAANNSNVTGESISNKSTTTIDDVLVNTTVRSQQVVYTVVPTGAANSCLGDEFMVTVNVNPEPVGVAATQAICSNAALSYDLQGNINGNNSVSSTFRWKSRNSVSSVGGESTVEQSTSSISDNLTNVTNADATVIYDIFPTSTDNCAGSMFTLTLTVHPKPNVDDATGLDVCSGDAFDYDLASHLGNSGNGLTANTVYDWSVPASGNITGESVNVRRASEIDDILTLASGVIANQTLSYTVTPTDQTYGCSGNTFSVEVVVKPKPTGLAETVPLCSDLNLNFDLVDNIRKGNNFITNTTYEWLAADNTNVTGESLTTPKTNNLIDDKLLNLTATIQTVVYSYVATNSNGCRGDTVDITVNLSPSPILDPTLATKSICSSSAGNTNAVDITLGTTTGSISATGYNITSSLGTISGFTGTPTQGSNLSASAISTDSYDNVTTSTVDVVYTVVPISSGSCLGTAMNILVTVHPEPVVNPSLDASVCSGLAAGIQLSTNGTSVAAESYTIDRLTLPTLPGFTSDQANIATGSIGGSALIAEEKYTNVTVGDVSVDYRIRATSAASGNGGGCVGEPQDIRLTVRPQPVFNSTAPSPICSGLPSGVILNTVATSVAAEEYNINGITRSSTSLVAGTDNASISFGQPQDILSEDVFLNNTANALTVTYKIAPVSSEQCMGVEDDLVLTVNPAPAVASNLAATICSNDMSGILLNTAAGVAATTYDIVRIDLAPGLVAASGNVSPSVGVINSAIQNDQFDNPTDNPLAVTYTVLGESVNQCKGSQKNIMLTVEPTVRAAPAANTVDICSDSDIDIELNSPTNPTSGNITFNYTVTSTSGQVTGFVGSQASLPLGYKIQNVLTNTSDSPTTITYAITAVSDGAKEGAGCTAPASVAVDVTIEPRPKLVASPASQIVCEGTPTAITLTTTTSPSVGGVSFNVISTTPTGGLTLSSPASPTTYLPGESIADVWSNPTLDYHKATYVLRADMDSGLGCQGLQVPIEVTVRPSPQLTPVDPTSVCSNLPLRIPLTMDLPGSYATWTSVAPAFLLGVADGGGNRIDVTPVNTALTPGTITYSVTPKIDACAGDPITVEVQVNPSPNTVGLPTGNMVVCDGQTLNVPLSSTVPGATTFDWTVLDSYGLGAPAEFDGSGTVINQQLDNPKGYKATLIYTVTPTSSFSCVGEPAFMNVEVISIVPSITPNKVQICSGEHVQVTNSSLGALSHRWFYRRQGTTDEQSATIDPSANYRLENTTSENPIYYEIVYEASNGACSRPGLATPPIAVYRSVTAGFNEGTIPPIRGGISNVDFTNTSDPIEGSQFRYEWNFGGDSEPTQYVGVAPPTVTYSGQGFRDVRVRVINNDSEAAGLSCEDTFTKTIVIPVLPLVADFTVKQPQNCIPINVTMENLSTGDVNAWRVVDENGVEIAVSNQNVPTFVINTSGEYTVFLTTRDSFTGQVALTSRKFSVYENPKASFLARPATVFIPDQELVITNSSEGANTYLWDFGDGNSSTEENPVGHKYEIEGVYNVQLVAGHDYGNGVVCRDTLGLKITARVGGEIKTPNSFTPNPTVSPYAVGGGGSTSTSGVSDGFNDVFLPIVQGVRTFNMQIYDRWGNLIFESNSATVGWDGRNSNGDLMPAGVYVYRLEIQLSDGNNTTKIGDITMLR